MFVLGGALTLGFKTVHGSVPAPENELDDLTKSEIYNVPENAQLYMLTIDYDLSSQRLILGSFIGIILSTVCLLAIKQLVAPNSFLLRIAFLSFVILASITMAGWIISHIFYIAYGYVCSPEAWTFHISRGNVQLAHHYPELPNESFLEQFLNGYSGFHMGSVGGTGYTESGVHVGQFMSIFGIPFWWLFAVFGTLSFLVFDQKRLSQ